MSKLIKSFKKGLAIVLSITTFAWALGPAALLLPTRVLAAEAHAGDLIKMNGLASVYYLGADSKRYVFPNETTYNSWYSDFSTVKTISQSELESYSLGSNVTVRPGTRLVKITTNPKVYAVEAGGILKGIPDEATAKTLYGDDWAKRVSDVPDAFFTNYTVSSEAISATAYPTGTLIKYAGSGDIYLTTSATAARKIATMDAFNANRYKLENVLTAPATITYTYGTDVTAAESTLVDVSGTGVVPGEVAKGVTVSLSSKTPASGTIITKASGVGQAIADLAAFDFKADSSSDLKVTSVKVKRTGISSDSTLVNTYLYDGNTRLTDNASVSSGYITWNNAVGIFTVAKGTTKTVNVKADIAVNKSGETVGVSLMAASDISSDATITGTFPMNGNLMSIAAASEFATARITSTTDTPAANTALDPQDDVALWGEFTLDIAYGPVNLESLRLRQVGSVLQNDLKNFELLIDSVKVGDTVANVDANGYVTFDLSAAPKKLEDGGRKVKVLVDIVDGSTRTASLSLRQSADIAVLDTDYNQHVRVTSGASTTAFSTVSSGTQTISGGSLTITKKSDSASGDLVDGATGVSLGKFEFKAAGESIKVETLRLSATVSDGTIDEIRNGRVYANGVQVGSTADIYATDGTGAMYTDYTLGSSLVINPGTPVTVEIMADVVDSDGTDDMGAGDTVKIIIESSAANNAQKMDSLSYFTTPATDVEGNLLTVRTGTLTLTKYTGYNDLSAVAPQNVYKLGEWRLKAATTESVNLTSLLVIFTGGTMNVPTKLSDVYVAYGTSQSSVKSTVASTSNTWTVTKTLAAGEEIPVILYGNVTSGSLGTTYPTLTAGGTTVQSSASADSSATAGQTVTWTTGSIATAVTAAPLSQIVYGNQMVEVANFEITPTSDAYTLTEFAIKVASGSQNAIKGVYLYDGATLLNTGGTSMSTYYATTTGMSLALPANVTKTITVKLDLNAVGTGAATPGTDVQVILDTIKVRNSAGTESYVSDDRTANTILVFKTYPIVTHEQLSATDREIINDTSQTIYKFKVAPSAGGTIALKQMKFNLAWVDGTIPGTLELGTLKFYRGSEDITDNVEITDAAGTSAKTGGTALNESDIAAGLIVGFKNSEELVSAETTYAIKATAANFDSGTTSSDKVTITMKGDDAANGTKRYAVGTVADYKVWKLATAAAGTGATAYNFIWSDRSSVGHAATSGTSSADWANGYKVKNLDLDTTVMDKNT